MELLLCAKSYSKRFIGINCLNLHCSPMRYILFVYPHITQERVDLTKGEVKWKAWDSSHPS